MHKTFIATALALGMCLPVYAEQFSNSNSDSMLSPVTVDEPNTAVPHREKLDIEKQQGLPIRLTGEHAEYDTVSGDFHAEGNIKVSQNGQDIYTTQVKGNMKTGDIWLLEGGKLVEGASETQAAWGHYNFNNKTGEMKKLTGKNGKDFFAAPHAEIYPDKMVLDEGGSTSRCPAVKHPKCLEIKAKTFEIYPHDKMVARDVKVYVRGKHIYSRDYWENSLTEKSKERILPHIGFKDSDKGTYVNLSYERPLGDKDTIYADLNYYSKAGYKPVYGLEHNERNFKVTYENGWYEDDDEWVEKQNNIRFDYKNHHIAPGLPLSYSAYFERGLWKNDDTGRKSWHTEYGAFLNHDRIYLFNSKKTSLDLTIGKKWTRESADDSVESTNVYYATLAQKISPHWNTWVGYYREDFTTDVFTYDQPDMAKELRNGLQYIMDDKNSFTIVNRYDLDQKKNYETRYSWTHKFCCWQLSLIYKHKDTDNKDSAFEAKFDFVNW